MIVTADLHLGLSSDSFTTDGLPSKFTDTLELLREMVQAASKEKDKLLVIAGDLFDTSHPKAYVIAGVFEAFGYAQKLEVQIVVLPGNHDCDVRWHALVVAEKANFPNVKVVTAPNTIGRISYLPHMPAAVEDSFLKIHGSYGEFFKKNKGDILIGHAHTGGAINSSEVEIEAGNALEFNPKKFPPFDLVLLGHVHKHQVIKAIVRKKQYGIVYPGSPVMCNFGEVNDEKGYLAVNPYTADWKFVEFETEVHEYKQIKLDLLSKDELDLDPTKIKKAAEGKLLKIIVYARDSLQIEEAKIRKAFNEFGKVVRFEYVVVSPERGSSLQEEEVVFSGLDHVDLLAQYLMMRGDRLTREERLLAMKLGKEVIAECLSE